MMYYVSKIALFLVWPSNVAIVAIGTGLLLLMSARRFKHGRGLALGGFALLLTAGFSPLGNVLMLPLEERFPRPVALPAGATGIIILGGFEDGRVSRARGTLTLNEAAERLTEGLLLARELPEAKVVFTGGAGGILFDRQDAADAISDYLARSGVSTDRIILERLSLNTFENAAFTSELVKPKPGDRWALVTSAAHMPRAMGTFRRAGFDVIAWPVDYRTKDTGDALRPFDSLSEGLERTDAALKEWVGLVAYRLLGRTNELFPGR